MGSLTVLQSETPTLQQEEKTFVNTLSSEMAKLGDVSASAASGPAGQQTINVNMGANNSYTPRMINALETAADKNVAVAMTLQENGQHMTFTVPADSDYSAVDSYFEQTASTSEGYRMIQSLVSGSAIEDASGNKIVNTTDTGTLNIKADADAILYGIDYSATIVAGGGFHGSMDDLASWNNPGAAFAITSGGTATGPAVNVGGTVTISAVSSGSTAMTSAVTSGGTAIDTTVNGGGSQTLHTANTATTAGVISGGTVTSGGTIPSGGGTIPSGGTVTMSKVTSGGTALESIFELISNIKQTIYAGGTVVAAGTLPDTASQRGTYAVTDNGVLIANDQGVFLASKGNIQKLE